MVYDSASENGVNGDSRIKKLRGDDKQMKKEWFFDRFCGRQFAALVEDGKLAEFSVEKEDCGSIVGNVYKGKVVNFVDEK